MTHPREINEDLSDVIARSLLMEWNRSSVPRPCRALPTSATTTTKSAASAAY